MTDHKFTDDEIVKALECCSKDVPIQNSCEGCPFAGKKCAAFLPQTALDLINRQKVEIESLKIANEKMYSANKEQEAEIEALKEEVNRLSFWNHIKRTAVIDEFAERLKKKYYGRYECSHDYIRSIIDALVKEMTEK